MANNNASTPDSGNTKSRGNALAFEKNWVDYLWIIRDHWLLGLLVALSASGFYVFKKTQEVPLYKSSTLLLFEIQKDQVINIEEVVDNSLGRSADYILRNHLVDLRSSSFRNRVVESLSPDETELIIKDYREPDAQEDPNVYSIIAGANHIQQLGGNIFNFEFHHRNPQAAALLANRFSEEFNDFLLERSRKRNEAALRFLRSQSEELKLKVERAELAVQKYRQERNLVSLEESQNLIVERMKNLSTSLNTAKVELLNLSATISQIENCGDDLDAIAKLPSINQMGTLPAKFEQRTNLIAERKGLALRYGRRHPKMIANQTSLESLETDIRATLRKNVSDIFEKHKDLQARVKNLEEAVAVSEKESLELDQVAIEYNVLRRKLDSDQRLFTQVHQRLNEAVLASQLTDTNLRVIDQAWPSSVPFTPDMKKIYSIGIALGILCFIAVPFAIHYLNLKLKTAGDIEALLDVPFLGEIRKLPRGCKPAHRLVMDQLDPQAAESFRQIHSQILLKNKSLEKGHTFVITSALPKEGKSFFAINLAASFSRHHYKTLLVDCDFRRPSIAGRLNEDLEQMHLPKESDQPIRFGENLYIHLALHSTVEATEWIESETFREHLKLLQMEYDVIVIDTSPAGLFPDAGLIGEYANHIIFLTELNKHRRNFLKSILNRLNQSNADLLGVVVNKVSRGKNRNIGVYRYADYSKYKNYYPSKVTTS